MLARHVLRPLRFLHSEIIRIPETQHRLVHSEAGLSLQYKDEVAVIRMDDKKENRMNSPFVNEFHSLLDSVVGDASCRGLVTVGEGKFYCNGLDLEWLATISAQELLDFMTLFQKLLLRVLILPVPTLAIINGHAFAGGAVLALAHDIRTMNSEKGWLCLNEVFLNKRFNPFLQEYLRIKLGDGKNLSDALVLGHRYTAEDAVRNNIIHAAYPGLLLLNNSLQFLESFTGKTGYPHTAVRNMKTDFYKVALDAFEKDSKERQPYFSVQFMTEGQLSDLKKL